MLLNAKIAPVMQTMDYNEFASEFYPTISADTSITPNLSSLETIFPYVSEFSPAPAASAVAENPKPTTQTPPIVATTQSTINTAVGQVANAVGNAGGTILDNLLNNVVQGLGNGVQESAGAAGATIANSTIKVWFKNNWYYVAGGVVLFFGGIWYFVKRGKKSASKFSRK